MAEMDWQEPRRHLIECAKKRFFLFILKLRTIFFLGYSYTSTKYESDLEILLYFTIVS